MVNAFCDNGGYLFVCFCLLFYVFCFTLFDFSLFFTLVLMVLLLFFFVMHRTVIFFSLVLVAFFICLTLSVLESFYNFLYFVPVVFLKHNFSVIRCCSLVDLFIIACAYSSSFIKVTERVCSSNRYSPGSQGRGFAHPGGNYLRFSGEIWKRKDNSCAPAAQVLRPDGGRHRSIGVRVFWPWLFFCFVPRTTS